MDSHFQQIDCQSNPMGASQPQENLTEVFYQGERLIVQPHSAELPEYIRGVPTDQLNKQLFQIHFNNKLTDFSYEKEENWKEKVHRSLEGTAGTVMTEDIDMSYSFKPSEFCKEMQEAQQNMEGLNTINQQVHTYFFALGCTQDPETKDLADFESIQVGLAIERAKDAKNSSK